MPALCAMPPQTRRCLARRASFCLWVEKRQYVAAVVRGFTLVSERVFSTHVAPSRGLAARAREFDEIHHLLRERVLGSSMRFAERLSGSRFRTFVTETNARKTLACTGIGVCGGPIGCPVDETAREPKPG